MSIYTMTQLVKAKELDIEWDREIYGFDVFPKGHGLVFQNKQDSEDGED